MSDETTNSSPLRRRAARWLVRALLALRPVRPAERRVVFLLRDAWAMGGTIRATLNLAGHLAQANEVEVISLTRPNGSPFFPFPAGVTVTAIEPRARVTRPRPSALAAWLVGRRPSVLMDPSDSASRTWTLLTDVRLLRRIWQVRPDVIIGTRLALNVAAADLAPRGAVAVAQEHMNLSAKGPRRLRALRERYPELDALVVLTDRDRRDYSELLPDGVRLAQIPNTARELHGGPSPLTSPVVLGVGRLTRQKGFDRLIRAFAVVAREHPDWHLRICGSGPRLEALQRLIARRRLGRRVTLAGPVPSIEQEMANASLLVLSSRFEGFPLVVLEAMSMGLPVVSFDCPTGPREIVEHGRNGLLVPDGDVNALARAIDELIRDEEQRRRLGAAALATAAEYRPAAIGGRWDALLDELRAERAAREPVTRLAASV